MGALLFYISGQVCGATQSKPNLRLISDPVPAETCRDPRRSEKPDLGLISGHTPRAAARQPTHLT